MTPALVLLACLAGRAPEPRPPDILLVVLDTVRADRLATYGHHRDTSRQLDAIAEAGVVFEDATVPASWTWPGHASLFTGEPPWVHGAHFAAPTDGTWRVHALREDLPTMAEAFAQAGYRTEAAVANAHLRSELGLTRGFERVTQIANDQAVVDSAVASMQAGSDQPLFLFVNLISAHDAYLVAEEVPFSTEAWGRLKDSWASPFSVPKGGISLTVATDGPPLQRAVLAPDFELPEEGVEDIRALYDGELVRLDNALKELIGHWTRDRPGGVVAVTSDHGEYLGEDRLFGHGRVLGDPVTRVPLVLASPGRLPSGLRVTAPVHTQDLYAALLHLAGLREDGGPLMARIGGDTSEVAVQAAAWPDPEWAVEVGGTWASRYRSYRRGDRTVLLRDTPGAGENDAWVNGVPADDGDALVAEARGAFVEAPPTRTLEIIDLGEIAEQLEALGYVER